MKKLSLYENVIMFISLFIVVSSIVLQFLNNQKVVSFDLGYISIIQFILTIIFSYFFTKISNKKEFEESQKRFALSAYRRVIETQKSLGRLKNKIFTETNCNDINIEVIREMALHMESTTISSIADWADIIGEEIDAVEQIREAEEKKDIRNDFPIDTTNYVKIDNNVADKNNNKLSNIKINELEKKLPRQLRITVSDVRARYDEIAIKAKKELDKEMIIFNHIELYCFYDISFKKNINEYKLGAVFTVQIGDVGDRTGAFIVYDAEMNPIGVVTNKFSNSFSYIHFIDILIHYINKSSFKARLFSTELPTNDIDDPRTYFIIVIARDEIKKQITEKQ